LFVSKVKIYCWIAWILFVLSIALMLFQRSIYKNEIHRVGNEKNILQQELDLKKSTSGHVENKVK